MSLILFWPKSENPSFNNQANLIFESSKIDMCYIKVLIKDYTLLIF